MRHRVSESKLGRTTAHRRAMLANMASSLIKHGRIETTLPKAKALRGLADRLVTLGKSGTLAARRRAVALIRDKNAVKVAFDDLAKRFSSRNGGYTRILKLGYRHGDSAPMAVIEYLSEAFSSSAQKGDETREKPAVKGRTSVAKAPERKKPRSASAKGAAKRKAATKKGAKAGAKKDKKG